MLSAIYGWVMTLRNALYDRGVFETHDLGAYTISIGNITTGGTGKTPLVAYVASVLATRGEKVCILTRGYGRKDPKKRILVSDGSEVLVDALTGGDEPVELGYKLLGKAIVIADADRVAAAEWAKRKFGVTAFVLDDGFQHRKAKRDVDIVCIDASAPFAEGEVLPSGRLREPIENLSRADVIVITRADLVDEKVNADLKFDISKYAPESKIFESSYQLQNLAEFSGKRVFAFAGIGNPENFFSLLRANNIELVNTRVFSDHHLYSHSDAADIASEAFVLKADILATTQKDAVKLSDMKFEIPCIPVVIETQIDGAEAFEKMF